MAATDARTKLTKDTGDRATHAAQAVQVFLIPAILFSAKFCIQKPRISVGIAKFWMSFAILARNTHPAPAKAFLKPQECKARHQKPLE